MVLDHCDFELLQKTELTKEDIKKHISRKFLAKPYLYQKAYRFTSNKRNLFVFTGIIGKLDAPDPKIARRGIDGKVYKLFVIKDLK